MAFFPIRPFWNDEWRLIYNIKFKDYGALWGRLDLLQECPRVYLSLLKLISAGFDYSYTSLRLPPLFIGFCGILLLFRLRRKLFADDGVLSFLFILIFISAQTFTDYLTQVKQYEMDLLLCLLALWQLLVLLRLVGPDYKPSPWQYAALCLSFLAVPYFSYTYPICVAPIYPVLALAMLRRQKGGGAQWLRVAVPLAVAGAAILVFYIVDVRHMLADKSMYDSYFKVYYEGEKPTALQDFWNLFALVGSGFLFELIFGALGSVSSFYAAIRLKQKPWNDWRTLDFVKLYALLLLLLVLGLLFTGKIVGGVARLTAYTVPSIALLIVCLLQDMCAHARYSKLAVGIAGLLFLGLLGNIVSSCINSFTYPEYQQRIATYRKTAAALREARVNNLPLLYSDGVCGDKWEVPAPAPGSISRYNITPRQIAGADTVAAEVIVKVNPEYKIWDTIALYYMPDEKWVSAYLQQLPDSFSRAMVGDGLSWQILEQ